MILSVNGFSSLKVAQFLRAFMNSKGSLASAGSIVATVSSAIVHLWAALQPTDSKCCDISLCLTVARSERLDRLEVLVGLLVVCTQLALIANAWSLRRRRGGGASSAEPLRLPERIPDSDSLPAERRPSALSRARRSMPNSVRILSLAHP